jgi:hypothetical protein
MIVPKVFSLALAIREFYPAARASIVHDSNCGPSSLVIEVPETDVLVTRIDEFGIVRIDVKLPKGHWVENLYESDLNGIL